MSAGEKRRILIARALVHRPRQLLLDEPSNALDLAAQRELRETLRRLAQEGTGLLLVTHHLGDILPEIERIILMSGGRIVGDGHAGNTLVMAPESLKDYLGAAKFVNETAETIKEVGIATGLAWTPVGGEILFIEATRMPGKGGLLLTGSLGEVMKESAQTAVSYLRSQAKALGIDMADYANYDLHIHVPAGATPKDGPSAGGTLVAALASLLTRRRVRSDVAMTGEISLRGRVMRVGGIKEKVLAAGRFGIKQIILPEQNRADWSEVPEEVRHKLKVHFIRHISELLPLALREK